MNNELNMTEHILGELRYQREVYADLQKETMFIREDIATIKSQMKIYSALFGAIAGSVPVAIAYVFDLFK